MEVYIVHKTTTETASVDPQSFFKCQKKEMKELKGQAGLSGLLLILRADILQVRVERELDQPEPRGVSVQSTGTQRLGNSY